MFYRVLAVFYPVFGIFTRIWPLLGIFTRIWPLLGPFTRIGLYLAHLPVIGLYTGPVPVIGLYTGPVPVPVPIPRYCTRTPYPGTVPTTPGTHYPPPYPGWCTGRSMTHILASAGGSPGFFRFEAFEQSTGVRIHIR